MPPDQIESSVTASEATSFPGNGIAGLVGGNRGRKGLTGRTKSMQMTLPAQSEFAETHFCSVIDLCIDFHFRATIGWCLVFKLT